MTCPSVSSEASEGKDDDASFWAQYTVSALRRTIDPVFGAFSTSNGSSTSFAVIPGHAWDVNFAYGFVVKDVDKFSDFRVRAVRPGP